MASFASSATTGGTHKPPGPKEVNVNSKPPGPIGYKLY